MNIQPDPCCVGCDYLGGMGTCDYILLTGTHRPCKPGAGCIVHTREGVNVKTRNWDTARAEALRAEGKTAFEIAEMVGASEAAVKLYFRQQCQPAAIAPARVPTAAAEPVPVPTKGMPAAELADILHELADRYPGAEISFDERPVRGVYLDVSFGSDKTAPVAVITMR